CSASPCEHETHLGAFGRCENFDGVFEAAVETHSTRSRGSPNPALAAISSSVVRRAGAYPLISTRLRVWHARSAHAYESRRGSLEIPHTMSRWRPETSRHECRDGRQECLRHVASERAVFMKFGGPPNAGAHGYRQDFLRHAALLTSAASSAT